MRSYIALYLIIISCSLQAMNDSSKRLKLSDSAECIKRRPLNDLVAQSSVYQALREDTGASEQECLDLLTNSTERGLLDSYAKIKEKDESSLLARSYRALKVSHLATLANAANKLDIKSAYHDVLDTIGNKIVDAFKHKQYELLDELHALDSDARSHLGNRMSLDLLAGVKMLSFADKQRTNQKKWFDIDTLRYESEEPQPFNDYFPIKKKIFEVTHGKILGCTIASDNSSIITAVKNKEKLMETLSIDIATGAQKRLNLQRYRKKYDVLVCPDGSWHLFFEKNEEDDSSNNSDYDYQTQGLEPISKGDSTISQGMEAYDRLGHFSADGRYHYQLFKTPSEAQGIDRYFTVVAYAKEETSKALFINQKFRGKIKFQEVSKRGRFYTVTTMQADDELSAYNCHNDIIYLYDAHRQKKHVIHEKTGKNDFHVNNVSFDEDESLIVITADDQLYVLDFKKILPENINLDELATENHELHSSGIMGLNHYQSNRFMTQFDCDGGYSIRALFKSNEFLLTLRQLIENCDDWDTIPNIDVSIADDTHIEFADMSHVYEYIKTLTSMTPYQVALLCSIINQHVSLSNKNAEQYDARQQDHFVIEQGQLIWLEPVEQEGMQLDPFEQQVYHSLPEDIKRHFLKTVKIVGITDQADDTSD